MTQPTGMLTNIVTLETLEKDHEVQTYLLKADEHLKASGYTEHGPRHATLVAKTSRNILTWLGHSLREAELASIAGYVHDIGNVVSRFGHGQAGAIICYDILARLGMEPYEIAVIIGAVGNHDPEDVGRPINNVAAATIIADKSDVHRSRVRNRDIASFDTHDRVNYAVEHSFVRADDANKTITLEIKIDTAISPVMDYFEIFLTRMLMCRKAARFLGCEFELFINGIELL